jgi:hypothetical protein
MSDDLNVCAFTTVEAMQLRELRQIMTYGMESVETNHFNYASERVETNHDVWNGER